MKLGSINNVILLRQILPSLFFFVCVVLYIGSERSLIVNMVFSGIGLLILVNVFLRNSDLSRVLGFVFLMGSLFMSLALFDDIIDKEAMLEEGYWVGLLLIIISFIMSILLILGYNKEQFAEAEK
jgi:hypothetical protein